MYFEQYFICLYLRNFKKITERYSHVKMKLLLKVMAKKVLENSRNNKNSLLEELLNFNF